jgi:hypothetical protein
VTLTLPNVIDKSGCRSEPGWYYDDPARPARILMCDATCAELSSNAANRKLDILLGCATVVRPIM